MPAHKKPANIARTSNVSVRLDPKLHYLTMLAGRNQGRTISSVIERAVQFALRNSAFVEDEPMPGSFPPRLQMDELWDVEESDRFYLLARKRQELLTIPEQRLWKLFGLHMDHTKRKITIAAFREFWNDPAINTSHLEESETE
jgi:hypothetical protein